MFRYEMPKLDVDLDELKEMSYQETAYQVMKRFLTDFTEEELRHCINSAYDEKFDTTEASHRWLRSMMESSISRTVPWRNHCI